MSLLQFAVTGSIALGIGYAVAALIVIAVVCVGVVRLLGGHVGRQPHKHGRVGAAGETVDPDDGTPHER